MHILTKLLVCSGKSYHFQLFAFFFVTSQYGFDVYQILTLQKCDLCNEACNLMLLCGKIF